MDSKEYRTQLLVVYKLLQKHTLTMLQVAERTGILRANICRYVRTLRKAEKIAVVKIDYCPITNHKAGYYTTDPALFPKKSQTELFDDCL